MKNIIFVGTMEIMENKIEILLETLRDIQECSGPSTIDSDIEKDILEELYGKDSE
jgi:hypothetical protein